MKTILAHPCFTRLHTLCAPRAPPGRGRGETAIDRVLHHSSMQLSGPEMASLSTRAPTDAKNETGSSSSSPLALATLIVAALALLVGVTALGVAIAAYVRAAPATVVPTSRAITRGGVGSSDTFSARLTYEGLIFLSAKVPTELAAAGNLAMQAKSVFEQIDVLLGGSKSDRSRMLQGTVFLTNVSNLAPFNGACVKCAALLRCGVGSSRPSFSNAALWQDWLGADAPPARTSVSGVVFSDPRWLLAVTVIAAGA